MKHKLIDYQYSTGDLWVGKGEKVYYFTPETRQALSIERCKIYADLWLVSYKGVGLCLLQDDRANLTNAHTIKQALLYGTPDKDKDIIKDEQDYKERGKSC